MHDEVLVASMEHESKSYSQYKKPKKWAIQQPIFDETETPADKGCFSVYWILFLQGCGMLFPWNAFITASSYFKARFHGTIFENNFENYFSISYQVVNVFGLLLALSLRHRLRQRTKIIWPLLVFFIIFACTTILVLLSELNGLLYFWLSILSVTFCAFFGALLSSGIFGLAAYFPQNYTQAVMAGQGWAGLLISLISLLTTIFQSTIENKSKKSGFFFVLSSNFGIENIHIGLAQRLSTFIYFLITTIVLLSCLLTYLKLENNKFARHHVFLLKDNDNSRHIDNFSGTDHCIDRECSSEHTFTTFNNFENFHKLKNPRKRIEGDMVRGRSNSTPDYYPNVKESLFQRLSHFILSPLRTRPETSVSIRQRRHSFTPRTHSRQNYQHEIQKFHSYRNNEEYDITSPILHPIDDSYIAQDIDNHDNFEENSFYLIQDIHDDNGIPNPASNSHDDAWAETSQYHLLYIMRHSVFASGFVFFVTLSIFPGLTSNIVSIKKTSNNLYHSLWKPLQFVNFNLFDFLGRAASAYFNDSKHHLLSNRKVITALSISRLIFFPLFLLCNFTHEKTERFVQMKMFTSLTDVKKYTFFHNDVYPTLLMSLFAISNGFIGSIAMMQGPALVDSKDSATAGTIMISGLTFGLALGSLFSFLLRAIMCQCNPFISS